MAEWFQQLHLVGAAREHLVQAGRQTLAGGRRHRRRDVAEHAEQRVLGADVTVTAAPRLLGRQLERAASPAGTTGRTTRTSPALLLRRASAQSGSVAWPATPGRTQPLLAQER